MTWRSVWNGELKVGVLRVLAYSVGALWLVFLLASSSSARTPEGKEVLVALSWEDAGVNLIDGERLISADSFRKFFTHYKTEGVDTVLLRVDLFRFERDYEFPEPKTIPGYSDLPPLILNSIEKQWQATQEAVRIDLLRQIVDIAHKVGVKIFVYNTTFDEGMPLNLVWYEKGQLDAFVDPRTGSPFRHTTDTTSLIVSKFTKAHPEYVALDRSQKKHNWGTLEFAYPEAREYAVGYNRWFLEHYDFDGIYIDFRNEFSHPEFADEFGFSPPIVEEYEKRYGVNILRDQFDLEKWRKLCGQYLTQYVRDLYEMAHAKGKPLIVGIPQGNYIGMPNGNMYVDWQGWVKDHVVDGLVIGVISGKFIFPDRVGYGYLTDTEFGIGLPNIVWDLQSDYWPLCSKYKVKLYIYTNTPVGGSRIPASVYRKTNVDGVFTYHEPAGIHGEE